MRAILFDRPGEPEQVLQLAEVSAPVVRAQEQWVQVTARPLQPADLPVPQDIPDAAACQISLNPLTAWALVDEAEATSGDWMVLTAGTSTVSNLIAAIARSRGVRTIGVVRGDAAAAALRSAADHASIPSEIIHC